jgi:RNA polymerase sigma factor (sigma-70 family)
VLSSDDRKRRFELLALPHLDAAYNLARWLAGNASEADDLVQETYLRAFRYFDSFQGGDMRVWLLTILRNHFSTWARQSRSGRVTYVGELAPEDLDTRHEPLWVSPGGDPEAMLQQGDDAGRLDALMQQMPAEQRTVLLLREVEELSYQEIATITGVPIGTVMSRLARARAALRRQWSDAEARERVDGM